MSDEIDNNDEENKVGEPQVVYDPMPSKKRVLKIYRSIEEQENEMLEYWATLTPTELFINLRNLVDMSFGFIKNEEDMSRHSKHIKFYNQDEHFS